MTDLRKQISDAYNKLNQQYNNPKYASDWAPRLQKVKDDGLFRYSTKEKPYCLEPDELDKDAPLPNTTNRQGAETVLRYIFDALDECFKAEIP